MQERETIDVVSSLMLIDLILIQWENIKLKRFQVHQMSKRTLSLSWSV